MDKCTGEYARQNEAVPVQPVLARIKVRPEEEPELRSSIRNTDLPSSHNIL